MQHMTLVNRTNKKLKGVWDGRQYDLAPGKHSFPEAIAMKFREQNPIMGSQDPRTLEMQYLIGIEEMHDDCSPLDAIPVSPTGEKWDGNKMPDANLRQVIKGDGVYNPYRDGAPKLPTDTQGWVKP